MALDDSPNRNDGREYQVCPGVEVLRPSQAVFIGCLLFLLPGINAAFEILVVYPLLHQKLWGKRARASLLALTCHSTLCTCSPSPTRVSRLLSLDPNQLCIALYKDILFSDDYDGGVGVRPPIQVFVQHSDESPSSLAAEVPPPEGRYREWNLKTAKSNSTGKLWRLRDVKLQSNSDGKDVFMFLNHEPVAKAAEKEGKVVVEKVETKKGKMTSSTHEKHYVINRVS
ncbi:hypothetical protein VNO78_18553 [Psophocarpus tetragonolobus]|uniref:Uncharacterized protein n=1 Tax=Psophocarpus tetragonolobus TaxID=3891 RepID=A0AAN9SIM1_PSOTE